GLMDSVHRDERSKYATAVYRVRHRWPGSEPALERFIRRRVFPQSWGRSASAWGAVVDDGDLASYWVLVARARQTDERDLMRRLKTLRLAHRSVEVVCALPPRNHRVPEDSPDP